MFYPSAIASAVASANADAEILTPFTLTSSLLFIAPTTSNLYDGLVVPIPTFGADVVAIPTFLFASSTITTDATWVSYRFLLIAITVF